MTLTKMECNFKWSVLRFSLTCTKGLTGLSVVGACVVMGVWLYHSWLLFKKDLKHIEYIKWLPISNFSENIFHSDDETHCGRKVSYIYIY